MSFTQDLHKLSTKKRADSVLIENKQTFRLYLFQAEYGGCCGEAGSAKQTSSQLPTPGRCFFYVK